MTFTIEYHHQVLKRLLAMLLVYAGLTDENDAVRSPEDMRQRGSEPFTLSRRVRDMVLRLLVPVESATRRLIVVLASQLPPEERQAAMRMPATSTPTPKEGEESVAPREDDTKSGVVAHPPCRGEGLGAGATSPEFDAPAPRLPLFALADTPKRFDWFFNPKPEGEAPWSGPGPERADPYERLDALPIMRRVAALALALDDLPRQTRRLLRWRAMRLKARASGKFVSASPLRSGVPPGVLPSRAPESRKRDEHCTLDELHWEARDALRRIDTS